VETQRSDFQPPANGVLAVEARMQLPQVSGAGAAGYWPAFWMLGAGYRQNPASWPGVGEIDVMENANGLNTAFGTAHCGVSPGGECHEKGGLSGNRDGGPVALQSGMHTYRVEWDRSRTPQELRWYLDGRLYHTVTADQLSAQTWSDAFGHGFYLVLDLAVGGEMPSALGGSVTERTASGGTLAVDYVSVESRG